METELDDWELSELEMDFLEKDAIQKITQRKSYSSTCTSTSVFQHNNQYSQHCLPSFGFTDRPFLDSCSNKVDALPAESRTPTSVSPKLNSGDFSEEKLPKLSVKFILHDSGNIAAKFSYDRELVMDFGKIPKATWNAKQRLWMFPVSSLSSAEKVVSEISGYKVEVENLYSLVQRAITAASATPDLRDKYEQIPSHIESKLLPFQRDGVRFALQHGGRVL